MKTSCLKSLIILCIAACFIVISPRSLGQLRVDTTSRHSLITPPANRVASNDTSGSAGVSAVNEDSLANAMKPHPFQPNPKKAGLYSAIVPGLGQFYNRQYWKIPIVYVGLATVGYFFVNDLKDYQNYRKAYIGRINNPYPTDSYVNKYSTDQLNQLQNDYNKYLDLSVMFGVIGYAMQVIDAVTGAHLKNFDISRDISMKVKPVVDPYGVGLGLVFNYK